MPNIAASDVTVTVLNQRKLGDSRNLNRVRLAFGDGTLTYPAGGVPITKGKFGCPAVIESMTIVDKGTSGYDFMYDQSAEKVVMFRTSSSSHVHDIFLVDNVTGAETNEVYAATNALGANTGSNITISGNAQNTGGVLSATIAASTQAQPSAVAIDAQTIEVEVIGW